MLLELAIVTVALQAPGGAATLDKDQARAWVEGASKVWKACEISLVHREHRVLETDADVPLRPASLRHLETAMRQAFETGPAVTVTVTGHWDRRGELGGDTSWAYGFPPRMPVTGVIAESRATERPTLLAHEIGHVLGLPHQANLPGNLMIRSVYEDSQVLSPVQCALARSAICGDRPCPPSPPPQQ